jgi:hypothetical protein
MHAFTGALVVTVLISTTACEWPRDPAADPCVGDVVTEESQALTGEKLVVIQPALFLVFDEDANVTCDDADECGRSESCVLSIETIGVGATSTTRISFSNQTGVSAVLSDVQLSPADSVFSVSVLVGDEVRDASTISELNPVLVDSDGTEQPVSLEITFAPKSTGATTVTLVLESDARNFEQREGSQFGTMTLGLLGSSE